VADALAVDDVEDVVGLEVADAVAVDDVEDGVEEEVADALAVDEVEEVEEEEEEDETETGATMYWNTVSLHEPPQVSPALPRQAMLHPALPSGAGPPPFWNELPQKHCSAYSVPE
jgi:hypothetical protein